MRVTRQTHSILGALGTSLVLTLLPAQGTSVEIEVLDATNGRPLPGARLVVLASRDGDGRFTGSDGLGKLVHLVPGRHTLEVSMAGFRTLRQEIDLSVDPNEVTVHLEPFRLVSLIQLLATPDRFDGLPVVVDGFCSVGFEDDALYLHKEDWAYALKSNALQIVADPKVVGERYNKKYVTVFGVFAATKGRVYAGRIGSIEKIVLAERRR